MASSLFNHARTVAIGENVGKEDRHVAEVLKANEYPEHSRSAKRLKEKRQGEKTPKYTVRPPYVPILSEGLRDYAGGLTSRQYSPQSSHLEGNSPELNRVTPGTYAGWLRGCV